MVQCTLLVNTRGVYNLGKLNYILAARAATERRPSRYPDVDFSMRNKTQIMD